MNPDNVSPRAGTAGKSPALWSLGKGASIIIAVCLAGCGSKEPPLFEGSGSVSYRGETVPQANVVFISEDGGSMSIGITDDQGKFTLTTRGRPGALAGSYKVGVAAVRLKGPVFPGMTEEQILANEEVVIPRRFGNAKLSGLTASIGEDPTQNVFQFNLK